MEERMHQKNKQKLKVIGIQKKTEQELRIMLDQNIQQKQVLHYMLNTKKN